MIKENVEVTISSFNVDIAGPSFFFLPRLTVAVYHDFLRNVHPDLLQHVDLQTRVHLRFMHEGPPTQFNLAGW
jgi:hypothetical protein